MAMGSGTQGAASMSAEPNVTPMIDVLLVLLIIFMAVLPSMRKAIDVQLPDPNPQVATANNNSNQIVLEVKPGGQYFINSKQVTRDQLPTELKSIYDPRPEKIIFLKADGKNTYQTVIHAIDIARGAGVLVVGIPPGDNAAGGAAAPTQ